MFQHGALHEDFHVSAGPRFCGSRPHFLFFCSNEFFCVSRFLPMLEPGTEANRLHSRTKLTELRRPFGELGARKRACHRAQDEHIRSYTMKVYSGNVHIL